MEGKVRCMYHKENVITVEESIDGTKQVDRNSLCERSWLIYC